ncbi:MAG: hypothetical protein ABSF14_23050, partial [Terriglobia bacterium]
QRPKRTSQIPADQPKTASDQLAREPESKKPAFFRSLFSPAEIAAPTRCLSRAPRSLRPQAARGAGHGNYEEGLVTAGLKPRPSKPVVRNPG